MKQNNFKNAQTHYEFILGPIKIKDGLFMGDMLAAKDIEFIISNKVTHIINTVSKVIPNLWERFGIQYLSVNWTENQQNIFDKNNNQVNAIFSFVEQAMLQGESCLIHSLHGKSRSATVMVAYLMKKYQWTLDKCLEYVTSKKDHLEVRDNYLRQMQELQKRMIQLHSLSNDWKETKNQEELLLKNTYQNSKSIVCENKQSSKLNNKRVSWGQKQIVSSKQTFSTITNNFSTAMSRFKQSKDKKAPQNTKLKSILKGDKNDETSEEILESCQKIDQMIVKTSGYPTKKENNLINTINGNVVHVTVNNFITTEKKSLPNEYKNQVMRPYSSDNKQRQEKEMSGMRMIEQKKNLFNYDTGYKSPYDSKFPLKYGGLTSKIPTKKQQIKNPIISYGRPQSANIAADRRRMNNLGKQIGQVIDKKEEMSITGKKRYPSSNPRQQLYRRN